MSTNEELKKRLLSAQDLSQKLTVTKARLEEKLSSEKAKLDAVVKEIKDKGFEPKNLPKVIEDRRKQIDASLTEFEQKAAVAQANLNAIATA